MKMTLDKRKELLTKAKPILFNTDMVRAILEGRKTVTRRVIKPQPIAKIAYCSSGSDAGKWMYPGDMVCEIWEDESYRLPSNITQEELCRKWTPPCNTDDILYVRETWKQATTDYVGGGYGLYDLYLYKADKDVDTTGMLVEEKWQPSTRMPKEAARIFLRVTDVRVERLQDITEDDIVYEGAEKLILCPNEHEVIEPDGTLGDMCWNAGCCGGNCKYIDKSYGELFGEIVWNSAVKKKDLGKYGWDANPWVWVIEFERID